MGAQERETYESDVEMGGQTSGLTPGNSDAAPTPDTTKAKQQDTGSRHRDKAEATGSSLTQASDPRAVQQQAASDNSGSSTSDSIIPSPSNQSTAATSLNTDIVPTAISMPSIDEQIVKVTQLAQQELQEGQKGYVVSGKWLQRVQSRGSVAGEASKFDKSATEGEIGPIDNSDIAMVIEESTRLLDEAGEPYVPLRPGLTMGEDYEVLPQEAWDLIVSWYGVAKDSPIITRYAHDWSEPDALPNVTWELSPPIFSFLKVPSEHTTQTQREKDLPPQRLLASKKKNINEWLKEGKRLLGIDNNTKVRVWRVLGGLKSSGNSGVLTPAASRSASPAPGAEIIASAGDKMLLDVNTFVHLQIGEQRELLNVPDHTANPKYNGKSTLSTVGLGRDEVIVLEEQKSGKDEWPSENPKLSLGKALKTAPKNLASSGRSSPAPGMMTRGRQKRDGRPRGITGLSNLGNTCYMNSALQCLRSVEELTQYFLHDYWKQDLNVENALGHHGEVAKAYANLLHQIYDENASSTNPSRFKAIIGKYGPSFSGYQQQDSQEFLLFLLDGLQEDLNRIHKKPYIEKPDSTDDMVHDTAALKEFADKNWEIYKARNDSVVTDLFAGMYKSTLTCPVCHKVSIIFDPFNNLTLQLPIENNWQKEILYFPLHKRPIRIDVDIDKHSSIKGLKEFVASRTHVDVDRLLVAEAYKNKIYKIFDNNIIISEANIQAGDIICVYELESVPTNYNPNKARKFSLYTIGRDNEDELVTPDSPEAERLLVPMYNRLVKTPASRVGAKPFFGMPTYLVLTREDRASYEGILKKILGNVAGMTTRKIFEESDNASERGVSTAPEDSDTVVMADDMSSTESNQPSAVSVQGEDGIVDVSMRDASQAPEAMDRSSDTVFHNFLRSDSSIPSQLRGLFTIHVVSTGEGIPTGWNQISESQDYDPIVNRIPRSVSHRAKKESEASELANGGDSGSVSSEDGHADIEHEDATAGSNDSDSESNATPPLPSGPDSDTEFPEVQEVLKPRQPMSKKALRHKNRGKKYGRRNNHRRTRPALPPPQPMPKVKSDDLIRPGEAIVLDWSQEAWDALFGGAEQENAEMRGAPTWKSVELFHDEELQARRVRRANRKKNGISLEDCLNEFGKPETLSEQNAWYCPRCKEHRRAEKMFELWKAPDILVMHLKRFSSNRNFRDKLEVKVDYPVEGLDLSAMVRDQQDGKSLIYDLIAVDNHYGGLGGGHYTAYAKNFVNNMWYEFNDSHVTQKSDPRSVVTSAAYLLFYRRRSDDHPLGGPRLQELLESSSLGEADSEQPTDSRGASPVTGEDRRLGDSSHNGLSSAYPAGPSHRVGADGSAVEEENQDPGLLAAGDSPPTLLGPPADDELPPYEAAIAEDEGIIMEDGGPLWQQTWGFDGLPAGRRVPAPSEEDGMFDDKGSSNDSTRVEGNVGSPARSLLGLDDGEGLNDPIYSEPIMQDEYGPRNLRESAPPPEVPGIGEDDEDDPPVMELHADPSNNDELVFNPASR
ncbi:putative ubiquitin carboxyl-terminal hydrolase 12 [Exophiala dermatitidis]